MDAVLAAPDLAYHFPTDLEEAAENF